MSNSVFVIQYSNCLIKNKRFKRLKYHNNTNKSFGNDIGDAHIPKKSYYTHKQNLIFNRYKPKIHGRCQRP
jgi:hypothetical protein